jgi:hypothetical protein
MGFWPFKRNTSRVESKGKQDRLVWQTNMLSKVALVPFVKNFPQYAPIIDSNLMETWDILCTIAMTGVSAYANNFLSDAQAMEELKISLDKWWKGGRAGFEDYYEYTSLRTSKAGAPWAGVSTMWVADNLRLHSKANEALKRNASQLDFINHLAAFMTISFGSAEVGLPHYLVMMSLEAENKIGIDMGIGTKGTKQDFTKKLEIIAWIFESFASKTVESIVEFEQQ